MAPHEEGMRCPDLSSGRRYSGQVEATYVWSDLGLYDRRLKLNTYLHEVLWELPMLAKLFATHNWMVAVQQAYKKWDKKTALEQLDILSAAMTDAAEEDPTMSLTPTDVGWLDGKVIYCEGYFCCSTGNILWLNDGEKAPKPWRCDTCKRSTNCP